MNSQSKTDHQKDKDSPQALEENLVPLKAPFALTLFVILIGGFMSMLDSSIVNVAIPSMMTAFGVSADEIDWVLTIYMLVLGISVPTSAWLGDYLGLKRLYLISMGVFTLGSLFCAMAWNVPSLTFARGIQAIGGGMIMPITMSMIYKITPRKNIGKAMGGYGMVFVVAPAIGPSVGGYLVEYIDWRWIFTINLPIGILGIALAAFIVPAMEGKDAGRFDWIGALLSAASMFCILFLLSEGDGWGWTSLPSIMILYLAIVFLGFFIWWELRNPEPLLDIRLFRYRNFSFGNFVLILITVGMYGVLFYLPIFLQAVRGMGALEVGLMMLPPALVSAVAMPVSGALYDKIGPRIPTAIGVLVLAVSTLQFVRIDLATPISDIILWNSIRSIGMGLAMMPAQTGLMSQIPTDKVGSASALNNIISRISGSFGIACLAMIMTRRLAYHSAMLTWNIPQDNISAALQSGVPASSVFASLGQMIFQTSYVRSVNDIFLLSAVIICSAILPALIMKKGAVKQHEIG